MIEMLGMVMNYLICNFIGSAAFFFCTLCFLERDKQVLLIHSKLDPGPLVELLVYITCIESVSAPI